MLAARPAEDGVAVPLRAPLVLPARRALLVRCSSAEHTSYDRVLSLPALKFYSPHVSLLIKKLPGALTSAPRLPSALAAAVFSSTLCTC